MSPIGDIILIVPLLSNGKREHGNQGSEVKRFGEKLRALRKRDGLTLKQLAAKLDFDSHAYLSAIEFGKKQPSVELVIRIAELFDVSTDDLLFDDKEIRQS